MADNAYQKMGLSLLNLMARSGHYQMSCSAYGGSQRQVYDSYVCPQNLSTRPSIIFFYGGAWTSGYRRAYRFVGDTLYRLGFNVYIPDYRLYPSVRFDEIQRDAGDAVNHILATIPEAPVFIMGHSAGAQLGALLTLNATLLESAEKIAGFIGLAGPYDFYPFTEQEHWDLFSPAYADSQAVNFVRSDAPPLYLLHGREDVRVRRGHSKSLMEKQLAVGGLASREVYDNTGHVDLILSLSVLHRRNSKIVQDIQKFTRSVIRAHYPDFADSGPLSV